MKKSDYEIVRRWMYRNARPLDLARWQFHFENGRKEQIIKALLVYQNEDGGFGHGLEADSWNEHSAPIQTWNATELLREINFTDPNSEVIQGILKYLKESRDSVSGLWPYEIPSNNEYPHAPWWSYKDDNILKGGYNPTASLLGFILYFGDKEEKFYQDSFAFAEKMIQQVLAQTDAEMHELNCFVQFLYYVEKGNVLLKDLDKFEDKLKTLVNNSINQNTKEWGVTYTCTPSRYIIHPESKFYPDNKELTDYECQFLINSRNGQGVWDIAWNWENYPKEFAISENWWKGNLAIINMLFLKNFEAIVL